VEAVIFVGPQGTGKTTYYKERFFETHVRISLDLVKTRNRELLLLAACLQGGQPFVVDNTNVLAKDRARYVAPARAAGFRVAGYVFTAPRSEALRRNRARPGRQAIPVPGVLGTYKRLQPPSLSEGFDELFAVELTAEDRFLVSAWPPPAG
jgi:predicted kinase